MKILRKKNIAVFALLSCLLVVFLIYTAQSPTPITVFHTHGSYVVNPSNVRAVVGWSSHVFVARVIREEGTRDDAGDRQQTFFSAEVLHPIKGAIEQQIMLNQFALLKGGVLIIEEGEELLQPDTAYLFVTRYDERTKGYSIFAGGYGSIKMTDEQQKADTIKYYTDAYQHEIPFDVNHPAPPEPAYPMPSAPYPIETSVPHQAETNRSTPSDSDVNTFAP